MTRQSKFNTYFSLIITGTLLLGATAYLACLISGKCYAYYDAKFRDVGICTASTQLQPAKRSIFNSGQLYFCGEIEGTTPRPGVLYLYRDDKVIYYTTEFWKEPGLFSEPLPLQDTSVPGHYRIRIISARRDLVEFTFEITQP